LTKNKMRAVQGAKRFSGAWTLSSKVQARPPGSKRRGTSRGTNIPSQSYSRS
jgi:hypothetical protein